MSFSEREYVDNRAYLQAIEAIQSEQNSFKSRRDVGQKHIHDLLSSVKEMINKKKAEDEARALAMMDKEALPINHMLNKVEQKLISFKDKEVNKSVGSKKSPLGEFLSNVKKPSLKTQSDDSSEK